MSLLRSSSFFLFVSIIQLGFCVSIDFKKDVNCDATDGVRFYDLRSPVSLSDVVEEEAVGGIESGSLCPKPCGPCSAKNCSLPYCKCSNNAIPGGLSQDDAPQIVVITLQNAVNNQSYSGWLSLFEDLKNPNGCPATGTLFASHVYTDYYFVQSLQSKGHEIGDNTVTSTLKPAIYWRRATASTWGQEIRDQASILKRFANVTDLRGFRAPYLQMGGDSQLSAMKNTAFPLLYDASRTSVKFSKSSGGGLLWPYSYDNQSTQDCVQPPCPRQCYPGVWEIPLLAFWDGDNNPCAVLDACKAKTYNDIFRLLYDRFVDHYKTNRAPLLISMNPEFLSSEFKVKGLRLFLKYLTSYKRVYFVSAGRALDWIQNPVPFSKLDDFKPWKCSRPNPPVCPEETPRRCLYDEKRRSTTASSFTYALRSCAITRPQDCPRCYPWVGDAEGGHCYTVRRNGLDKGLKRVL